APRPAVADVVDADVELVLRALVVTAEDLRVAAGQVAALDHQHATPLGGEAGGGAETAGARPHHHDVPLLVPLAVRVALPVRHDANPSRAGTGSRCSSTETRCQNRWFEPSRRGTDAAARLGGWTSPAGCR